MRHSTCSNIAHQPVAGRLLQTLALPAFKPVCHAALHGNKGILDLCANGCTFAQVVRSEWKRNIWKENLIGKTKMPVQVLNRHSFKNLIRKSNDKNRRIYLLKGHPV